MAVRGVPRIFRRAILDPTKKGASPFPCPMAQPSKRIAFKNVVVKATTSRGQRKVCLRKSVADNLARTELRTEHRISRSTTSHARRALQGPGLTTVLTPPPPPSSAPPIAPLSTFSFLRVWANSIHGGPFVLSTVAQEPDVSKLHPVRASAHSATNAVKKGKSRKGIAALLERSSTAPTGIALIKDTLQGAHVWLGSSRRPALVACVEHTASLPDSQGAGPGVEGRGGVFDEQLFLIKLQSNVAWTFQGDPHRWLQASTRTKWDHRTPVRRTATHQTRAVNLPEGPLGNQRSLHKSLRDRPSGGVSGGVSSCTCRCSVTRARGERGNRYPPLLLFCVKLTLP